MFGWLLRRIASILPPLGWIRSLLALGLEVLVGLLGELLIRCLVSLDLVELAFLPAGIVLDDTGNLSKRCLKEKKRFATLPFDL